MKLIFCKQLCCCCEFRHRLAADHNIRRLQHSRVCRRRRQDLARSMDKLRRWLQQQHLATDRLDRTMLRKDSHRRTKATSTVVRHLPAKAMDKHINQLLQPNHPVSRTHQQAGRIHRLQWRRFTMDILAVQPAQTMLAPCTLVHSAHMTSSIPLLVISLQPRTNLRSSRCRRRNTPVASQRTILAIITDSRSLTRRPSILSIRVASPVADQTVVARTGSESWYYSLGCFDLFR